MNTACVLQASAAGSTKWILFGHRRYIRLIIDSTFIALDRILPENIWTKNQIGETKFISEESHSNYFCTVSKKNFRFELSSTKRSLHFYTFSRCKSQDEILYPEMSGIESEKLCKTSLQLLRFGQFFFALSMLFFHFLSRC